MINANGMQCCGWKELSNLQVYNTEYGLNAALVNLFTPGGTLHQIRNGQSVFTCGSLIFTANINAEANYATRFANDIRTANLGSIVEIPRFVNPNTGRVITTFIWTLNKEAILAYMRDQKILLMPIKPYGAW